ncbi:putative sigma-54 modulation protein [Granulicella rosea]|uniref:Ribosome hibernation promoting factor n=1 Tax=Granulicella rosea TaxID=474952 RepID=A0A239EGA8_9BACT|nr:ribosome-associated translation inhibitor RaiA [Granulicella rosea]SNS43790.1 putative sigma-54 modulation protein [Granulicella rosea]
MAVEYTGRHTTVTVKLKKQAEAGLAQIGKLGGCIVSAHVILTVDKYRQIAEITANCKSQALVATCEASEMSVALHDALAKIEQQVVRHKQKKSTTTRHPKTDLKAKQAEAEPVRVVRTTSLKPLAETRNGHRTVGRKPVPVSVHSTVDRHLTRTTNGLADRPMSIEQAVKESDLRDRDVFVFRDLAGIALVLHRTRQGGMELIEVPASA